MNVTNLKIWDRIIYKRCKKKHTKILFSAIRKNNRPSQQIKAYSVKPAHLFRDFTIRPHFCDPIKGASKSILPSLSLSLFYANGVEILRSPNYWCESHWIASIYIFEHDMTIENIHILWLLLNVSNVFFLSFFLGIFCIYNTHNITQHFIVSFS